MKPVVGAIHELPLPQVLAIEKNSHHTCIQQRQYLQAVSTDLLNRIQPLVAQVHLDLDLDATLTDEDE